MKITKILCLSVAAVMASAQAFAQSSTSCGSSVASGSSCWTCGTNCLAVLDSDGVMTISAKNGATNVYMEDHADGYRWGSAKNKIKEVIIGEGISYVGRGAFRGAPNIESVEMSNSVKTIGWQAFEGNNLHNSLEIPNSVTSIGLAAFWDSNLTSLTIPSSVTKIDTQAFAVNELTSMTIPSSVKEVGNQAFRGNSLLSELIFEGDVSNITFGTRIFQDTPDDVKLYYPESEANRTALTNMLKKAAGDGSTGGIPKDATLMAYNLDENGNRVLSKGYKYDSNGNLVEEYVYSPDGRSYQKYSADGTLLGKFNADGSEYVEAHEVKRIYTVSEAEAALGKNNRNTFSIRYR